MFEQSSVFCKVRYPRTFSSTTFCTRLTATQVDTSWRPAFERFAAAQVVRLTAELVALQLDNNDNNRHHHHDNNHCQTGRGSGGHGRTTITADNNNHCRQQPPQSNLPKTQLRPHERTAAAPQSSGARACCTNATRQRCHQRYIHAIPPTTADLAICMVYIFCTHSTTPLPRNVLATCRQTDRRSIALDSPSINC